MIGNLADARVAYGKYWHNRKPKGWKKIGEGVTRCAYLAPDGVTVYKVGAGSNPTEHAAFMRYRRWKSLRNMGVYIPDSTLYHVEGEEVLAMPFIDGEQASCRSFAYYPPNDCTCLPESRSNKMCYTDLMIWLGDRHMNDLHSDNMRVDKENRIWVIDLGHNEDEWRR